ncbi:MAG: phosphoribosylformylglycinamidine synthase subunit PurS [Thermoanaerobacterales bacterium]|nr:phosphoribosylformylglycinamidine synthase subunit PurS [Thermoanaerobacterales bacterium]
MLTAIIRVSIREGVLDPQGSVTTATLKRMGIQTVKNVSFGRLIKIVFDTDDKKNAESQVVEMCEKLLVNPVLEDYEYEISEV